MFVVFSAMIAITGCGNGQVPGGGTVKYSSGEVVPSGIVIFSTPQLNYTGTIKNGVFELGGLKKNDGLPPGTYKVHLIGETPVEETDQTTPLFAEKYRDPETSGIVLEIKSGQKNRFDIVVEKP
ncbi:MAG: hypothetical protein LBQ66_04725 [Planctomycetaceae bacterium]|nr:hypothetical protein [Planctomycetaceae bacterium]